MSKELDTLKINLLWNYATSLSNDTHAEKLLKSYYVTNCYKIAKLRPQAQIANFGLSQMCPHCCSFWNENEYKLKLNPQKVAMNAKTKKLIAKLIKFKKTGEKGLLSKKQRKRAKWLQKRQTSTVHIQCQFCQHKSHIPLIKSEKNRTIKEETAAPVEIAKPKKKKKKNVDKTAGLKIPKLNANLLVKDESKQVQILPKMAKTVTAKATNSVEKIDSVANAVQELPIIAKTTTNAEKVKTATKRVQELPKLSTTVITPKTPINVKVVKTNANKSETPKSNNAGLSQTLKANKKKKNKPTAPAVPVTQKKQSKTQQKNSLLQLAALLKQQSSTSAKNATQNRLASLLN